MQALILPSIDQSNEIKIFDNTSLGSIKVVITILNGYYQVNMKRRYIYIVVGKIISKSVLSQCYWLYIMTIVCIEVP